MYEFDIPDMSCGHCVSTITKAIKTVDTDAKAEFDLGKRKARIDSAKAPELIGAAIDEAGYSATFVRL